MPPTDGLTSVPDRPLTHAETQALDQHPSLRGCHALFRLGDAPDTIVTVYLTTADQTHLLVYNPRTEHWERITTFETPDSHTESPDVDVDAALDVLDQYYGEEDLVATDISEGYDDLIELLPPEPLSEEQFATLREQEVFLDVLPLTRRVRDNRLVLVLLLTIDLSERQSILLGVGYDPADGAWHLIETLMKSELNEVTHTELMTTLDLWLENRYADEDISLAEEVQDVLSS
jgi:hypothetical protein